MSRGVVREENWHAKSVSETLALLSSDPARGLPSEEARRRREIFGPNRVLIERGVSPLKIFARQFRNLMITILLIATAISAALGEIIDAIVIFVIVLMASALGFWQEFRSERIVEALKKFMTPSCSVLRDGVVVRICSEEVVPGDVLVLEAGDKVVADARVIESFGLQTYEAALTGESTPIAKTVNPLPPSTDLADRTNMVYSGTVVSSGKGKAVVLATGMSTVFGGIAREVAEIREERAPLVERMDEVAKTLGKVILLIIAVVTVVEVLETVALGSPLAQETLIRIFMFALALAVAAVPEALPAIVTSTLAVGMLIIARRNAVVRRMAAVETLGSTQVICTDKTGTVTRGEMVVRSMYVAGVYCDVSDDGSIRPLQREELGTLKGAWVQDAIRVLLRSAILCSDASVRLEDGKYVIYGDPTEGAIMVLAEQNGLRTDEVRGSTRRIGEIPFSSERKRMTTIVEAGRGLEAHMKGAPEIVIPLCESMLYGGDLVELSEERRTMILRLGEEMASQGLRVLAVATRRLDATLGAYSEEGVEKGFTLLGLVGMVDPPRPEVAGSVSLCRAAGIRPVMVTGDHASTAVAVAREVGIYSEGEIVMRGSELDHISDDELAEKVEKISVYARVAPSHKLRIIEAWKRRGKVVAMTGDGVNDAPALKKADIGIAMGIKGTEVAKEASDIILLDDNFATIVRAVELGRWIYDNIKKYLSYLLQANLVEIAVTAISSLMILPLLGFRGEELLPLLPVQILYINLATDGLPAIALGLSPPDPDLMRRPPRPRRETVFTREVKEFIVRALIVETPVLLAGFLDALPLGIEVARSRLFLMFIVIELVIALNCRSLIHSIFKTRPHRLLVLTIIWEIFLISLLASIPITKEALHIVPPSQSDLAWIIGGGLVTFTSIELLKRIEIARIFEKMYSEKGAQR
jgi:Ca2+-transporting ATPase